jgi:hypothetical protein
VVITEGKTGLTEFSSTELDRLLAEARATLEEMRADRPAAGGAAPAVGEATGGRVTATAEHGRLTAVEFAPEARDLPSGELAGLVVSAVNAALDAQRPVPAAPGDSGGDAPPQDLQQMEMLTQAINDALGRIG